MKKRNVIICLMNLVMYIACCSFITGTASAGSWYDCKVSKLVPWADGQVMIQVIPADGETAFTETGRVSLYPENVSGGKNMLATLLTAVSLDLPISIYINGIPSWAPVSELVALGLITQ